MEIGSLPTEVLTKLLGLLPTPDLKMVENTSGRFNIVVNQAVGVMVAIGQRSPYLTTSAKLDEPEKVLRKGVSWCYVGDLLETIHEPQFSYPNIVKRLQFEGPITQLNFHSLLVPLTGLQRLCIHFSTLASPGVIIPKEFFSDCLLQTFSITSNNCKRAMEAPENVGNTCAVHGNIIRFTNNLINILKYLKSPRLKILLLSFPLISTNEKELTELIIQCISRHGSTIKNVQVYWECVYKPPYPTTTNMLESHENIHGEPPSHVIINEPSTSSSSGSTSSSTNLIVSKSSLLQQQHEISCWSNFKGIGLKRFSFACFDRNRNMSDPQWNELIRRQKNLEEFFYLNRCKMDVEKPFILKTIGTGKFSINLKKILIHLNSATTDEEIDVPLNCEIFQDWPNLTHLLLRGEINTTPVGQIEKQPSIENIRMLSKNITVLSIRDALIKKDDVESILGLNTLKKLRLQNIGHIGEYGLSLKNFFKILEEKKVHEIEFVDSINLNNPPGNKLHVMQFFVVSSLSRTNKFHAILDKDQSGGGGGENGEENGNNNNYIFKEQDMFEYREDVEWLRANDVCNVVFQ